MEELAESISEKRLTPYILNVMYEHREDTELPRHCIYKISL